MKAIYLSSILGDDLLPPNSAWTDFEQKLSDILSAAISDLILDSCIFVKRILQTLNPDGDCQGLGWVGDLEGQKTLLCLFLDSAGRFAAYRDPSLQTLLPTLRLVIDRWNKELKELAGTSEWQILGIVPRLKMSICIFSIALLKTGLPIDRCAISAWVERESTSAKDKGQFPDSQMSR